MPDETIKHSTSFYGGNLFFATVVSVDPATMVIEVAPDGQDGLAKQQGIPLASTFAHALGFKETVLPNIGGRVLCFGAAKSATCVIIGTIPLSENQGDENTAEMPSKATFGIEEPLLNDVHATGYASDITKALVLNNRLPVDVIQGEKVISNEFGVLLGLFQLMAVLKGSELAQVQCHFLDDLVRIISHNFQHYTALGEYNVFHDGKSLNIEAGLTHEPNEALGSLNGEKPITEDKTEESNWYKVDEQLKAIERLKIFIGKLGDFINILLVSPNTANKLNGETPEKVDRGLFQCHLGLDGLLIVRSLKGIILEKTNWIRVPYRKRTPEDPKGDDGSSIDYKLRQAFGFDNSYTNDGSAYLYYLQLKDYLAYIEEDLGYSHISQHKEDFYVNGDYSKEKPLDELSYIDPVTGTTYLKKRSIVSLMPNGGITMGDAWGSAIIMEGGNIYIQPAKDLVVQTSRNVVGKIGGNLSLATKNEIDLSSTEGGLRVKTNKAQYLYSQNGGILLHTDSLGFSEGTLPYNTSDPIEFVAGIVMTAPNSTVSSYGRQVYNRAVDTLVLESNQILTKSKELTRLLSDNQIIVTSEQQFLTSNKQTTIFSKGTAIFMGDTSTAIAKKGQKYAIALQGIVEGLFEDEIKKQKDFFTTIRNLVDTMMETKVEDSLLTFKLEENFTNIKFRFLPSIRYGIAENDIIPQTLVQQEANSFTDYKTTQKWIETAINETYPYPGKDMANCYVTMNLSNINNIDKELVNKATDLKDQVKLEDRKNIFTEYTI